MFIKVERTYVRRVGGSLMRRCRGGPRVAVLPVRLAYGMIRLWLALRPIESPLVELPWQWLGVARGLRGE